MPTCCRSFKLNRIIEADLVNGTGEVAALLKIADGKGEAEWRRRCHA